MIFLSTCSNYGKSTKLVDEDAQLFPVSIYAISKVNAEKYLLKNIPDVTILRCATAYGVSPGRTRWDVILNDFVNTAVREKSIDVFQPNAHRPIVHVKDISRAIALVIEANNLEYKVYNIGDVNYTKKDLVKLVVKRTNATVKYVEKDDNRDYKVNFKRAFTALGFEVTRDIEKDIDEMANDVERQLWCGG
jgi:nucleoside-diphosphate-sugar epimerase